MIQAEIVSEIVELFKVQLLTKSELLKDKWRTMIAGLIREDVTLHVSLQYLT
jgi:hypothetical protein